MDRNEQERYIPILMKMIHNQCKILEIQDEQSKLQVELDKLKSKREEMKRNKSL